MMYRIVSVFPLSLPIVIVVLRFLFIFAIVASPSFAAFCFFNFFLV